MPITQEGQLTMEKTPSYFVTKEVPGRIHAMSKDTKLIVVVRDPVTRAISDYTQTRSKKPDIPSFESLTFKNLTANLIDISWSAVQIGMYARHLEQWLQFFPMSQLLFVSGERLISDPAGEMTRVQHFLGLRREVTHKHFHFNPTKGFPCLKRAESNSKPHCLGKTKGRTHPNIHPDVIQRLRAFYKPFNKKFYRMTGHDFGWDWFCLFCFWDIINCKKYRTIFYNNLLKIIYWLGCLSVVVRTASFYLLHSSQICKLDILSFLMGKQLCLT